MREELRIITYNILWHDIYVKNILFTSCPGNMCIWLLCDKHWVSLRSNVIMPVNLGKKSLI